MDGSVGESSTNDDESDAVTNNELEDIGMDINLNEDTDMDQPQGLPHHDPLNLENQCHLSRLACQRQMSNLCRNLQLTNLHTHTLFKLWTVSHRKNADSALLTVTQSPEGPANNFPHAPILLVTHQTEFNMDALRSQHVVGGPAGREIWRKYMFVFVEELLILEKGLWAQTPLFVVHMRAVRLHGYAGV